MTFISVCIAVESRDCSWWQSDPDTLQLVRWDWQWRVDLPQQVEVAQNQGEAFIRITSEIKATSCSTESQPGKLTVSLDTTGLPPSLCYLLKSLLKVEVNIWVFWMFVSAMEGLCECVSVSTKPVCCHEVSHLYVVLRDAGLFHCIYTLIYLHCPYFRTPVFQNYDSRRK